mgnify:FL=1
MVTIPDLSRDTILGSLGESLNVIENRRAKDREYLLDYYEGMNMDFYVKRFFGSESLSQVPIFTQNMTRRVCKIRSMTYKRPPKMSVDKKYLDFIDTSDLNSSRRQLEQLTFLLGTMAFRSRWDERKQKISYDLIPFFEPIFLPGEREPVGIMFAIENHGSSRLEKPWHAIWTEERDGVPGMHFLIDQNGNRQSVNSSDINPYGVIPVVFTHRYKPMRDWYSEGALDVIRADLSVSVAMTELSLAVRFGAIGIKFITGVDDASRIEIGVDKILYLPEGSNFGVTAPSGSLTDIIDSTRFMVEATLNNNHIRIKFADTHGNAPSAESLKIMEYENYDERTASTEDTWRPFEKRRFEIDKAIIEAKTNIKIKDDYRVDFLEPDYPMSVDQEINYWNWKFDKGLATPKDWFDYMNPDASEEDRSKWEQEREEQVQPPQNRLLQRLQGS